MALTTSLVEVWELAEASGNALGSFAGIDLTETSGTIDSAAGPSGLGGSRDFEAGDTEYFAHADSAALSTGDIDFAFSAWVNAESFGTSRTIISKDNGSSWEYQLYYSIPGGRNKFAFYAENGGSSGYIESTTSPSAGTWYHVMGWHDSVNNRVAVCVNAGTPDSTAYSAGVADTTHTFFLGESSAGGDEWDGLISQVVFWKRVPTAYERWLLYAGGAGLPYARWSDSDTGAASPGTLADSSAVGTLSWSNPTNAASSNDVYATATQTAVGAATTHYLKATGFGLSVPAGATIRGIVVAVERKANGTAKDANLKLVRAGTVETTDKANTALGWLSSDDVAYYGGANDLWGASWTAGDVNDSGFGVVLAATITKLGTDVTASVDQVTVTVFYTPAGAAKSMAVTRRRRFFTNRKAS